MASANASDCVKVAIRVRPFVQSELTRGCENIIEKTPDQPQLVVKGDSYSKHQDCYTFNDVYTPEDSQLEIYNTSVQPIIGKLFEGYNVTILAYGQTGSGKTYTMGTCFEGNWDNPCTGIIPRALKDIFVSVKELKEKSCEVTMTCSFMELYQENLYDLLSGKSKDQSLCEIREDSIKGIIIAGLTEQPIANSTQAAQCLMEGGSNRTVGATAMNDVSSRSHAIFTVNLKVKSEEGGTTKAKFHLVDLAGSERSKKTKATGTRFREGVKINHGLLALGNVISALGGGTGTTGGYISYRDSNLTRLLQDSLGGNSVTLMIACVSPADYNIEETLSTLRYADRAKKIKNKPVKNLDSNKVEIQRLKDTIRDLRASLDEARSGIKRRLSTSGVCDVKCIKEKAEKDAKNYSLRQQLSQLLTTVNGLNSLHLMEETFRNELIENFEKLRDLLLQTCPAEFAIPDTKIFDEINERTKIIDELIKNYNHQMQTSPEDDVELTETHFDDDASNQKMLEYTDTQMQALQKIKTLEREMKIKQELLDRKFLNAPFLNDETEKTMLEYQTMIKNLEKDLEELRANPNQSSAARRDHNATKVNMDRKHKIEKLEKDLLEMRKKCSSLERTKKLAEQDHKRIEDLRKEILQMKSARIQLIRQQRTDSERYKKWIASRDKEINALKRKGDKVQNEMKRMEQMHERQQAVLKRKVEEAKAVNKRLQDVMDRHRAVQAMRKGPNSSEKDDDAIHSFVDNELMMIMSTIDAKITMQSLMNDRGLLNERLLNLKATVNKSESIENEIVQLEEDLEVRNSQIAEIRQKIMESDLEAKLKSITDNFNKGPELKTAMTFIIRALIECREDFTSIKTKVEDMKMALETSEERVDQLNQQMKDEKEKFQQLSAEMEHDFETKVSLMRKMFSNPKDAEDVSVNNQNNLFSMSRQLCDFADKNSYLQTRVEELEKELERVQSDRPKTKRQKKVLDETFNKDDVDVISDSDDSDEFDFNDSFTDPEWRKTPAHKRSSKSKRTTTLLKESVTNRMDGTGILNNISETSDSSSTTKRSYGGHTKCSCKGSCATKLCGCKKATNFCSDLCKCSDACLNIPDDSIERNEEVNGDAENATETHSSPKRERTKLDFSEIATPYYPYQSKKRKPLLEI
ncbi:CLUMA_CG021312, isoform A [Clunio marinus]|uniref:CLUMA_CG021312, isoform A n=1 Tax=Clunio marinus TaxID=568069 RepID=A0A1J1J8D5_9DIPT|nr:CLUMA_CG021312, isoform A [Clunio marinus]